MLTVQLARLPSDTAIKVNSAAQGYTATDLNGFRGTQTIPEGAVEPVRPGAACGRWADRQLLRKGRNSSLVALFAEALHA
jgi:NAD(P)-dependent dehydrogenase (short-subunit alcohol dehydrogenase family)